MSGFEPGEGWREVDPESVGHRELHLTDPETGRVIRAWVREEPVPPLPNVPYTVIRVTHPGGFQQALMRTGEGHWVAESGISYAGERMEITSFEVLSEPRAVTAKAVLDRVTRFVGLDEDQWAIWNQKEAALRAEFGVEGGVDQ